MALAGALEIQLSADSARLKTDLAQVKTLVGGTAKDMETAFGKVGDAVGKLQNLLGALGVGASIGGLVMLGKAAIDAADHINDLTKSTGLAVEELAGLGIAAKQSGADLNSVADGITKMSQNMGKNADMFKALGITAKEPLEAFKQAADMFAALGTEQEKAAFGLMVFGKSWATMAPLLAEGGKKIGEMTEEGAKLSGMTKEIALQSDAFNDSLVKLTGTGGAMNMVLNQLLPLLNMIADDMLKLSQATAATNDNFNPLLEAGKAIVIVFGNVAFVLKGIGTDLGAMAAQLAALVRGDLKAFTFIAQEVTKDAAKARVEFDRWEQSILKVGTAAQVAAGKLDAMDQISRRMASDEAAQRRKDAEEAGKRLAAGQNLEKAKSDAAAAEKKRLAELERLAKLSDKSYADFHAALEKIRDEESDAAVKALHERNKETEKFRKEDIEGWVKHAEAVFDAADKEQKAFADLFKSNMEVTDGLRKKQLEQYQKDLAETWKMIDDAAFDAFESMLSGGEDTFKKLGESLKRQMIRALYELTIQRWTLQLAASIVGPPGQAAAGAAGGMGGMSGYANLAGSALGVSGLTTAGALSAYTGAVGSGATAAGLGAGAAAEIGSAAAGAVVGAEAISAAAAAVVPVIGWVVAAAALVYALYSANKEPAAVRGGLGFGGPFEDQTAGTKTPFGTIGFSDVLTQQFSGEVGKAFTDAIGTLLTEGAKQLEPEAIDAVTKQMHDTILLSAEGTFTTEEFLSRFGPDMARQLLDPMLEAVDPYARELVDTFEGPLQDMLNLAADLLAVTGALSERGDEFTAIFGEVMSLQSLQDMQKEGESFSATLNRLTVEFTATNAVAVLFGKTQEETWGAVGLASEEARAQLIEFSGGIDNLNASLNSYYDHYFTAEEKKKMQQDALAESFKRLNVEMPTTREGFRDLIEKTGVATEADRKLVAELLKLEGTFFNLTEEVEKVDGAIRSLIAGLASTGYRGDPWASGPGSYFGVQVPTQAQAGKGGGRFEVPAEVLPYKTQVELAERLLQVTMTSNEVMKRNRDLQLQKLALEEKENKLKPGTLTDLQKEINLREDEKKAIEEATKAFEDMANAAGLSKSSLQSAIAKGLEGGDLGTVLAETLGKGIKSALQNQAAKEIADIFYDGFVKPMLGQIAAGGAVAEVLSAANINAMVENAKKYVDALKTVFNDPAFKEFLESLKKTFAGLNTGPAATTPTGPPAEWQFLWHGPGPNDGEWVNQQGVHSSFPGLPADQGGAAGIEDQRLAMLAQIYDLLGDKVNALVVLEIQRSLALQKLAPELRGLQTQLWGLQDAAEAAAKALEFEQTKRQLLIQITRAQGWEEAARDMERADQLAAINKEYGEGTVQAQELITLYQQLWWAQDHAAQSGNDMLEWVKSLQDWLRALTLDETLSPLTARQRFAYAQEQYVEALMGAQGGDAEARARFTETADAYLRESLSMFGRASNDYNAIYNAIVAQTEGLIAQGLGPAAPVTMSDLNVTLLQGQQTAAEQMSALLAKVDNLVEATTDGSDTVARSVQNIPLPTAPLA